MNLLDKPTTEVLELRYARAKLKAQTSLRWVQRKSKCAMKAREMVDVATEHYKADERAMIEAEMDLMESQSKIKKIQPKVKSKSLTPAAVLEALNKLPKAERKAMIAKMCG